MKLIFSDSVTVLQFTDATYDVCINHLSPCAVKVGVCAKRVQEKIKKAITLL